MSPPFGVGVPAGPTQLGSSHGPPAEVQPRQHWVSHEARTTCFLARIIIDIGAEVEDENHAKLMVRDLLESVRFISVSVR